MRKQKKKQGQEQEQGAAVGLVKAKAEEDTRRAMKTAATAAVVVVVVEEMTSLNLFPHPSPECSVKNVPCIDFMGMFRRMFGRQYTKIFVKQKAVSCFAQVTDTSSLTERSNHLHIPSFFHSVTFPLFLLTALFIVIDFNRPNAYQSPYLNLPCPHNSYLCHHHHDY